MSNFPAIKGIELRKFCETLGFIVTRQKGSHVRMKHHDGRVTTIPIHGNSDVPKGLLRKIIKEDLDLTLDEFLALYLEL